ncbi:unnamed protein product [Acanthoscelides obtectus]|uniref:Uncharacterized protein n=1 Tax=Acanthoscelides obtectus TaxID=200917 RepID=A0A9P0P2B5_ACAOB|nr:unnamed protein product [Acanthoscelides obtectus]CAK1667362.1 hypothetical protein AOBTE_LOCUS25801 [Acanthoscelides obtectus]
MSPEEARTHCEPGARIRKLGGAEHRPETADAAIAEPETVFDRYSQRAQAFVQA